MVTPAGGKDPVYQSQGPEVKKQSKTDSLVSRAKAQISDLVYRATGGQFGSKIQKLDPQNSNLNAAAKLTSDATKTTWVNGNVPKGASRNPRVQAGEKDDAPLEVKVQWLDENDAAAEPIVGQKDEAPLEVKVQWLDENDAGEEPIAGWKDDALVDLKVEWLDDDEIEDAEENFEEGEVGWIVVDDFEDQIERREGEVEEAKSSGMRIGEPGNKIHFSMQKVPQTEITNIYTSAMKLPPGEALHYPQGVLEVNRSTLISMRDNVSGKQTAIINEGVKTERVEIFTTKLKSQGLNSNQIGNMELLLCQAALAQPLRDFAFFKEQRHEGIHPKSVKIGWHIEIGEDKIKLKNFSVQRLYDTNKDALHGVCPTTVEITIPRSALDVPLGTEMDFSKITFYEGVGKMVPAGLITNEQAFTEQMFGQLMGNQTT